MAPLRALRRPEQAQIIGLGCACRQDDLAGCRTDKLSNGAARILNRLSSVPAKRML
jgi:hypothetical protein